MRILIATGGTGGHIYPAVSLANQLIKDDKDNKILFVGNSDRMEADLLPKQGFDFIGIKAAKFNSSSHKLQAILTLYKAYKQSLKIVEDFNADVVIGFGGYVTVPVILAGKKLKKKTIIHEQNSLAGMANRTLAHFVDKVVICYPSVMDSFNKSKTVLLGNPRQSAILGFQKDKSVIEQFGLNPDRKTLLIVMGSLGSKSVNEKMISILKGLNDKDYNVIYVTGKNNYQQVTSQIQSTENVKITDYIDGFNVAGNCDLVMSRAGATSLCEYCALALPSILVPSPYVTNNHQLVNALSMVEAKASVLLEEKDLNEKDTINLIDSLIHDDTKLKEMSQGASSLSFENAAIDFVELIKKVVGK